MRNSMTVVAPRESARAERDGPRVRPERVNSPTLLKRRSYRRPPHTDGQGHRGHDHHRAPPAHYAHYDRHASDGGRGVVFSRDAAADVWLNRRHHHRPPCRPARIGHHHHRSVRRSCYTRWWRGWSWYPSFAYVRPSTVYVEQPVTVVDACTTTPGVEGVYVEGSAYDLGHAEPAWVEPSTGLSATVLPQGRDATGAEEFELLRPMQEGDRAFAAGDFAEARRHYVRAQLDGRFYAEATLAYAITRFAEGEYAAAAMGLRRGLEALPDAIDFPIDVTALYAADLAAFGDHVEDLEKHLAVTPFGRWRVSTVPSSLPPMTCFTTCSARRLRPQ